VRSLADRGQLKRPVKAANYRAHKLEAVINDRVIGWRPDSPASSKG
jgi:hypothetical protein